MNKLWKVYFDYVLDPTQKTKDDYLEATKDNPYSLALGIAPVTYKNRLVIIASETHKDASNAAETAAARYIDQYQVHNCGWEPAKITITKVEVFKNADDQPYDFAWV